MFKRAIAGTVVSLLLAGAAHAQLSETEQRIVAAVTHGLLAHDQTTDAQCRPNLRELEPDVSRRVHAVVHEEIDAPQHADKRGKLGGRGADGFRHE